MNSSNDDTFTIFNDSAKDVAREIDFLRNAVIDELVILSQCHTCIFGSKEFGEMYPNDVKRRDILTSVSFENLVSPNKRDNAVISFCTIINHLITRIETFLIQNPHKFEMILHLFNNNEHFTPMQFLSIGNEEYSVNIGSRASVLIILFLLLRDEWNREQHLKTILESIQSYASEYLNKGNKIMSTDPMMTFAILINTQLKNMELYNSTVNSKLKIFNIFIMLETYMLMLSLHVSSMNPLIFNRITGSDYDPVSYTYSLINNHVNYVTDTTNRIADESELYGDVCVNISTSEIDKYIALLLEGVTWYVNVYRSFINLMLTVIYKRKEGTPNFNANSFAEFINKRYIFNSMYNAFHSTETVQIAKAFVLLMSIQNYVYNSESTDLNVRRIKSSNIGNKDKIKSIAIADINATYLKQNNNAISLLLNPLDKNVAINNIDLMKGINVIVEYIELDTETLEKYKELFAKDAKFPPLLGDGKTIEKLYKGGSLDYVFVIRSLNANVVDNIMFISYTTNSLHEILNDPLSLLVHPLHLNRTYNGPIMRVYEDEGTNTEGMNGETNVGVDAEGVNANANVGMNANSNVNSNTSSLNTLKLLQLKEVSTFTVSVLLIIIIIMIVALLAPSHDSRSNDSGHSHAATSRSTPSRDAHETTPSLTPMHHIPTHHSHASTPAPTPTHHSPSLTPSHHSHASLNSAHSFKPNIIATIISSQLKRKRF